MRVCDPRLVVEAWGDGRVSDGSTRFDVDVLCLRPLISLFLEGFLLWP
jgi:hypothetical protein